MFFKKQKKIELKRLLNDTFKKALVSFLNQSTRRGT